MAATVLRPLSAARHGGLAAGAALVAAGLVVWAVLALRLADPPPAPYRYRMLAEGKAAQFAELGAKIDPGLRVRKVELAADGSEALALAWVATGADAAPVLLEWHNRVSEPVLRFDTRASDIATLAQAVAQHAGPGATVLSWGDTSRQLKLLAGTAVAFERDVARPLLLPDAWRGARAAIERTEEDFWQAAPAGEDLARFERYVDTLVSAEPDALATLRAIAGPGEAYLVVQLADAYRAGRLRPDRLGIGYRDFPQGSRLHGTIATVKAWLKQQGYEAYAVDQHDPAVVRVYFLTRADSQRTLIARLLPFSSSNPFRLDGPRIVFQEGPYWVYRIAPATGSETPRRAARAIGQQP